RWRNSASRRRRARALAGWHASFRTLRRRSRLAPTASGRGLAVSDPQAARRGSHHLGCQVMTEPRSLTPGRRAALSGPEHVVDERPVYDRDLDSLIGQPLARYRRVVLAVS